MARTRPAVPADIPAADLTGQTTETLLAELQKSIRITAERIAYMAAIWTELESRGVDLSAYRTALTQMLPRVARGQVAPGLLVRCLGNITLLDRLAHRPIERQEAALDETIDLVRMRNYQPVVNRVPIAELTARDARIALDESTGEPIPADQQIRSITRSPRQRKLLTPTVQIDGDAVVIGRQRIDGAYLRRQLSRLGWIR